MAMYEKATARWEKIEAAKLCRFLESFSTKLQSKATELLPYRRVFWTNSSSSSSDGAIQDKIKTAFCNVYGPPLNGLIQFWAPVKTTGGRQLLSTSDQPFVIEHFDPIAHQYRLSSLKNQYIIHHDDDDDDDVKDDPNHNPNPNPSSSSGLLISNSPVAAAYLNQFPEVLVDLGVYKGSCPLIDEAIGCGFSRLILFPVFYQSSCVGVVECCIKKVNGLLVIFDELKLALEKVGLSLYHVQECLPYKTMPGFKHIKDEIEEALKIVCESFHLSLAQVWIANKSTMSHVSGPSSSSSSEGTFVVKLCSYYCDDSYYFYDPVKVYCDKSDLLPLRMGEGVPGITLKETKRPHFFTSLSKLRLNGVYGLLFPRVKCSCFAICLRSTHTGDVDYAFEFIWSDSRKHVILLESLLLTLKTCLPSFKFASGTQLGDELFVIDVQDATRPDTSTYFHILKDNKLREQPQPLEGEEWQGPKFVRRKLSHLPESEIENESEAETAYDCDPDSFWSGDDDICVLAQYIGKRLLFIIRPSYTLADVKKRIEQDFHLDPRTYYLEYEKSMVNVITLNTDDDLAKCFNIWTSEQKRSPLKIRFRLQVIPC